MTDHQPRLLADLARTLPWCAHSIVLDLQGRPHLQTTDQWGGVVSGSVWLNVDGLASDYEGSLARCLARLRRRILSSRRPR